MSYASFTHLPSVADYRSFFIDEYCCSPIVTFDNYPIYFYENHFDHAFYTSYLRQHKDKSVFDESRAIRIKWIKQCLEDPSLPIHFGYVKKRKCIDSNRRVCVVPSELYTVVITINKRLRKGNFITHFNLVNEAAMNKILQMPSWK